ncbi:bifunctional metallophosphatase/5'-nucleotidase [Paraglaciecola sp.]|uniref:bifunctional metallophosphatase/5'-nucleotidase n=1 Tax=Paraglaciecola sp. TaxID=1920173 RepID=UPI0030F4465A
MLPMSPWTLIILLLLAPAPAVAEITTQKHLTLIVASNMPDIGPTNRGSYSKLASLLQKSRQEDELSLFVFGGSSLGPSPLSSLDRGSHIIDILNTLEPDLMAINKREFSYFEDELTLRSYEAAFPFISSNLYDPLTKGNLEGITTNIIIDKGDVRVGFIAILDDDAVEEYLLQRVKVHEPQNLINQQVKQLKQQGAELVVLIYSQEIDYYQTLLDNKTIDFALKISPYIETLEDETLVKPAKRYTLSDSKTTLMLKLTWPQNSPKELTIEEISLDLKTYSDDTATVMLIDEYNKRLNRLVNHPIGVLTQSISSDKKLIRTEETVFGNFIADALKETAQAEIALMNGGSIRGDRIYQANTTLTRGDIIRELPFRSHLAVVSVSGKQLWAALENSVSQVENIEGRFLQVSGINFHYSMTQMPGRRIQSVSINGKPLVLTQQYVLATSDYLIAGGDGFTSFSNAKNLQALTQNTPLLSDIVIRAIQKQKTITTQLEARIVRDEQ